MTDKNKKSLTIIGNGFDLSLGALTAYEDFYKCLKKCFVSKDLKSFEDSYLMEDNIEFVRRFYYLFSENKDNYFSNYFLRYEKIFGNWVSFEEELSKILAVKKKVGNFIL